MLAARLATEKAVFRPALPASIFPPAFTGDSEWHEYEP